MTIDNFIRFAIILPCAVIALWKVAWATRPFKLNRGEKFVLFRWFCMSKGDDWPHVVYCNLYLTSERMVLRESYARNGSFWGITEHEIPLESVIDMRMEHFRDTAISQAYDVRFDIAYTSGQRLLRMRMRKPGAVMAFFHQYLMARNSAKAAATAVQTPRGVAS